MGLKEESKKIFEEFFGPEVARQLDLFEDPNKYPNDFIQECIHFLAKFIGEREARRRFEHLIKKYNKNH